MMTAQWTLCRKLNAYPILDDVVLQHWTELGRVRPDDYLVSHKLDVCVQAKDIAELDAVFRKATARLMRNVSRGFVCIAMAMAWLVPLLAGVMLAAAIGTAIVSHRITSRDQTYRIHTAGDEK